MDEWQWQKLRLERAKDQCIYCTEVECTDDGFVFTIVGTTGEEYLVEIYEDAGLWFQKSCSCDDNYWRPGLQCKHLVYCLRMMGVSDDVLEDASWEPAQHEIYDILCNAPDCVGGHISRHGDNNKQQVATECDFPDSQFNAQ